jgi:hypothetical protein
LKQKTDKLHFSTDIHLEQQRVHLLEKLEKALKSPGEVEVSTLERDYDILAATQPSTKRTEDSFKPSGFMPVGKQDAMPIEEEIKERVSGAPRSFEELCKSIRDYSPDVLKPVVFQMVLSGKLRLVGRKLHGESN